MATVGLVVGSFVNLVAVRLVRGEPVGFVRSRAECCGATLSPRELVPVISWLAQRRRCRRCGAPVTARHPLVELAGAGIGIWSALSSATLVEAGLTALLGWQLMLIALVDGEEMWLPDRLTLPVLASGLMAAALVSERTVLNALLGAGLGFGLLWMVASIYGHLRGRQGLGGGDPILLAAVGAWVGWIGLPSVLLWASVAALSWVGARALSRRMLIASDPLPFGPFIAFGAWLTWLYGPIGLG